MDIPSCIPRVEPSPSHRKFVEYAEPDCVMINLIGVRRLLKRGETAASYFPDGTSVMVTSTIPDEKLELISWEKERDLIREFSPDYHLPTDYPTYGDQPSDQRLENVRRCMDGTVWMMQELEDTDITVIPLVKGVQSRERRVCYEVCDELGKQITAYYATQHFTSNGNNITAVEQQVEAIAEYGELDVIVIGLLSPNYLERLSDGVIAATGQYQWRSRVAPSKQSEDEVQDTFETLSADVKESLNT